LSGRSNLGSRIQGFAEGMKSFQAGAQRYVEMVEKVKYDRPEKESVCNVQTKSKVLNMWGRY